MSKEPSDPYIPYHDYLLKADKTKQPNINNLIQNSSTNNQDNSLSVLAFLLLRNLVIKDLQRGEIQDMVNAERQGNNPNVEGMLRQILEMRGVSVNPDILYGRSVPEDIRLYWQEQGMDPDSENEVFEFFKQNSIEYLSPLENPSSEQMEQYAKTNFPSPDRQEKPSPKGLK